MLSLSDCLLLQSQKALAFLPHKTQLATLSHDPQTRPGATLHETLTHTSVWQTDSQQALQPKSYLLPGFHNFPAA